MKILLLNDTSNENHWGCKAAGGQVLAWIEECSNISIKTFDVNFSWQFKPTPNNVNEIKGIVESKTFQNLEIAKEIQNCDRLIINGEGTILGNRTAVRNLLLFNYYAIKLCKKCAVVNSTIYTKGNSEIEKMMSFVFPFNSLFTIREIESYSFLKKIGCKNIFTCTDSSFQYFSNFISKEIPEFIENNSIALFGSVLLKKSNTKLFEGLIKKISQLPEKIYVISMSNLEHNLFEKYSKTYNITHINRNHQLKNVLEIIGGAKFVITGRFHGAIMSFCCKVPFFHFETHSPRIKWLCKQAGISNNSIVILDKAAISKENISFQEILTAQKLIKETLNQELKYQLLTSIQQNSKINDFISHENLHRSNPKEPLNNIIKNNQLYTFEVRAKKAAGMIPPKLKVVDFGGGVQLFTKFYDFHKYLSFDLLLDSNYLGKPAISYGEFKLPYPQSHYEIDIESDEVFELCKNFDIAVILGVIMWLKNWRSFLDNIAQIDFSYILLSWDKIGILRVSEFLSQRKYYLISLTMNKANSYNALFRKY